MMELCKSQGYYYTPQVKHHFNAETGHVKYENFSLTNCTEETCFNRFTLGSASERLNI